MKISSPAFKNLKKIPVRFTCRGNNINPPLIFESIPKEAKSLALIVDDPDASMAVWNHWTVWNIDVRAKRINENSLPEGAIEGETSFGTIGYGGPCPPFGTHRYFFRLYALDSSIDLPAGASVRQLNDAMKSHIIAVSELVGLYNDGEK